MDLVASAPPLTAVEPPNDGAPATHLHSTPSEETVDTPPVKRGRGRPPKSVTTTVNGGSPAVLSTKRGRGRPPKVAKATVEGEAPASPANGGFVVKRGRGRPPKASKPKPIGFPIGYGLLKRGRGRPPKSTTAEGGAPKVGVKRGPGRPPKSSKPIGSGSIKRGRGRPPKFTGAPIVSPVSVERGRGRPPKAGKPKSIKAFGSGLMKSGRGRPPKSTTPMPKPIVTDGSGLMKRGRGRPPKSSTPKPKSDGGNEGAVSGRKRGRPKKIQPFDSPSANPTVISVLGVGEMVVPPIIVTAGRPKGPGKLNVAGSRPRGRPRKYPAPVTVPDAGPA